MARQFTAGVGVKLVAGFLVMAAVAAIIGYMGLASVSRVNGLAGSMYANEVSGMRHASQAQVHLVSAGRSARNALLAADKGARIGELYFMRDHIASAQSELEDLATLMRLPAQQEQVTQARQAVRAYGEGLEKLARKMEQDDSPRLDTAAYLPLMSDADAAGELAATLALGLVLEKQNSSAALADQTAQVYDKALHTLGTLTLAGVLLAFVLGLALKRGLMRQLGADPRRVVAAVQTISRGDLATPVNADRAAPGSVMQSMAAMKQALAKVVAQVHAGSDEIAVIAHDMAHSNGDLARRTEDQVAELTETAGAMTQLAATVRSTADVAGRVANRARQATDKASEAGSVVSTMVSVMADIQAASERVADIVSVIDSIAFQTNILALNAAVEAARAGAHGKGFAVVAGEVRSLAQRVSTSAGDIRHLIAETTSKVTQGHGAAGQARQAMASVVEEVQAVSGLITEISRAADEQTAGIDQVNAAVTQLTQMTGQNVALVEASARVSDAMQQHADQLVETVSLFRLQVVESECEATFEPVDEWVSMSGGEPEAMHEPEFISGTRLAMHGRLPAGAY